MAPVLGNPDITLDFEIEFKDVQNLQRFEEKVQNFLLALQSNRDAILCLQKHNSQLQKCSMGLEDYHFSAVDDSLDTYLVELSIYTRNVQSLLTRIHGRSKLVNPPSQPPTRKQRGANIPYFSSTTSSISAMPRPRTDMVKKPPTLPNSADATPTS